MQTCTKIDISSIVSLDYILKRFTVLGFLGEGFSGIVIKALDTETNEVVALKSEIILEDKIDKFRLREIVIGCALHPTRPYTHSIMMPINWAIVSKDVFLDGTITSLPKWSEYIEDAENIENARGLVFTMPVMDHTLARKYYTLTEDEKRDILFELIVALQALRNIGIVHGDLNMKNILLKQTQELRSYTINNIRHIVNSQYMPMIIDFEYAKINLRRTDYRFQADWQALRNIFYQDLLHWNEVKELLSKANFSVLSDEFFKLIRERSVDPGSSVRIFAPLESF